jgi:hypothetical protein
MKEFQGWTRPARTLVSYNQQPPRNVSPHSGYEAHAAWPNEHNYNVHHSPHPTQQRVNPYEISPPRVSYGTPGGEFVSPNSIYGYQYQNTNGAHQVLTPPRDQPPTPSHVTPQNIDNNYYPSPPMSHGSWNVPTPESAGKTTVEGNYGKPYYTSMPPRHISPASMSANERPITRPTVTVNKGYEGIPAFPMPQQNSKYRPVVDIRQESKNRQQKEHLMLRPGIRPLPCMNLEQMATSTRVRKPRPPVPNHQSVNAFKYKLDHDRETIARSKALSLMNILNPDM